MKKRILSLLLVLALAVTLVAPGVVFAMPIPELIITEIVPASAGTGQPYEYVEIYNTTDQAIDLQDYKLLYYTSNFATPANTWTITDKVIPARSALVLWLKKYNYPNVPLVDFNANYGTSLTPQQVFEVKLTTSAQGLADSAKRRVAIARADKSVISAAYLSDGVADGITNKSVTYKFGGEIDMAKIANGQIATPGALVPEQMPPSDDKTPPAVPSGLTAVAGAGTVTLSWNPVTDPDLAGYRIYRDDVLVGTATAMASGAVLDDQAGGTYLFTVSSLDLAANESAQSAPVSASPTHEVVTQQERGTITPAAKYEVFNNVNTMGPVIPGLVEDLIPQGLAWWPGQNWLVTSHYMQDLRPSVLTVVDATTGALVKSLRLYQEDGSAYTGHAGGVAITGENLWVANAGHLFRIPLADMLAAPDNGNVQFADRFPVETNASFVAFQDGTLWVGEFYHPTANYHTKPYHLLTNTQGAPYGAWIAGYRVDPRTDRPASATPDRILSVGNKIQGMALTPDAIVLSESYGRNNDSFLYRYGRPDLTAAPHQTVDLNGLSVPVWFLDQSTQATVEPVLPLPPLAEGIATDGGDSLYVLFESGANEYRHNGANPLDRWGVVNLANWSTYGTIRVEGMPDRVEVGQQVTLKAIQSWGYQPEVEVAAVFTVADGQVASVSADGSLTALAVGDTMLTASFGGQQVSVPVHVVGVTEVRLSGAPRKLTVGQAVPLKVEVLYTDGTLRDVTALSEFDFEHGGEVAVEAGLLSGLKPGDVRLVARYGSVLSNEMRVIVAPAEAKK